MEEEDGLAPEHLRCNRTDGRDWRCNRLVMEGKKLCEVHYIQARRRQRKEGVPDSLKLQRRKRRKKMVLGSADLALEKNRKIRAKNVEGVPKFVKLGKPMKRKQVIGESEALDEAVRKMKLKKGDPQLELIRMVLNREIEKRKKKEIDFEETNSSDSEGELMKQLPNGLMAISSSPHFNNVGSCPGSASSSGLCVNVKIGEAEADTATVTRRQFRSKNIEPLPIGTLKVVPYKRNLMSSRRRRKRCHRCRKGSALSLIECSNCGQQFFCVDCVKERYFLTQEEVKRACPVCRGTCGCKACSVSQHSDSECKVFLRDKNRVCRVLNLHYLMCKLLPLLKQINQEQSIELEIEAKMKGTKPSDVQIQLAELGGYNHYCCSNCKTSIVDFHRSCPKCSYNLCLSCCREFFQGSLAGSMKALLCKCQNRRKACTPGFRLSDRISISTYKQNYYGAFFGSSALLPSWKAPDAGFCISCPPSNVGGCGNGLLGLRCLFPLRWIKELEISAEEIVGSYEPPEAFESFSFCSLCVGMDHEANRFKQLQEAARREDSNDNFLYYPTVLDNQGDNLDHFQKHWSRGHPVIVRNVLQNTSDLSWDPLFLFCSYLKNNVAKPKNDEEVAKATSCLDWFEVEIGIKQLFLGSFRGQTHANTCDEKLKLKGWLSSHLFQEQFPTHYAEIIHALPLPDYMDPNCGLLNIAANLPQEIPKHDFGPCLSISYQSGEELGLPDSVTKLCYNLHDVVNILVHATELPVSMKQLNRIRKLMKKKQSEDQEHTTRCTHDQKMADNVTQKSSSQGENKEDVGLNDMIGKEVHGHEIAPKASQFAVANHEARDLSFKNRDMYPDKEDGSDTDSDSDCNSSSEAPAMSCGTESLKCYRKENLAKSCGAQWDVFRRQDVPKLMEYIRKHSNELNQMHGFRKHVVHPILDQNFFLGKSHKARLKEEYEIEPWSFEQHVGEAVIIPAGCPYQIRNVKSCVNVVLDFVSPENTSECIQLIDELRLLPEDHKARSDKFEVNKMALYSISSAIKEIRELTFAKNSADHS
ncbi:hypothetical protein SLEP1_g29430 [Rubroshorea leprosula]|uniref:Lysine-specific demethylase JMJ25 n=1 Tax=Rubroshorea leprosula TaxID=152421 RepID=A0AAV5JZE8_9ROSI|nr:hypothetical protein SLEP1_g29430 [Rubroshorea leprosula]